MISGNSSLLTRQHLRLAPEPLDLRCAETALLHEVMRTRRRQVLPRTDEFVALMTAQGSERERRLWLGHSPRDLMNWVQTARTLG